jgi:hypothetical protein
MALVADYLLLPEGRELLRLLRSHLLFIVGLRTPIYTAGIMNALHNKTEVLWFYQLPFWAQCCEQPISLLIYDDAEHRIHVLILNR